MQLLYRRIVACRLTLWDLPEACWAERFLRIQIQLFRDVCKRCCKSEKALFFPCILRKIQGKKEFSETKPILMARMDTLEADRIVSFVRGVEEANNENGFGTSHRRG